MSIFSHQDDETFSCGGTLAKYSKSVSVSITADPKREDEFKEACSILNTLPITLNEKNITWENSRKIQNQLSELIVKHKPQHVITHIPNDYHKEHRITQEIVLEAVEWASHTTQGEAHQVSNVWSAETTVLIDIPEVLVDISDTVSLRDKAIKIYESQSHKGGDNFYSRFHSARTHLRGIQAGTTAAEAFIQRNISISGSFKPRKNYSFLPSFQNPEQS